MDVGQAKRIVTTAKKSENVTSRALETYERNLKRFDDYRLDHNILDFSEVTSGDIREFPISLKEKGLRGITLHQYFTPIK